MQKLKSRKIIKEQGKGGGTIFRYEDAELEDNKCPMGGELDLTMAIIFERFKQFLSMLGDAAQDGKVRAVLNPIIRDAEREVEEIIDVIQDALGPIYLYRKENTRYENFYDYHWTGFWLGRLQDDPAARKGGSDHGKK